MRNFIWSFYSIVDSEFMFFLLFKNKKCYEESLLQVLHSKVMQELHQNNFFFLQSNLLITHPLTPFMLDIP